MNQGDEEQLAIAVIAKLTDLEKQMAKANGITARAYREMSQNSRKATKQMEQDAQRSATRINQAFAQVSTKIGSFGKAFVGGLAAGAAIGALEGIRQAALDSTKSILELADQARMAGVSFKAFQGLKIVAEQNRVGVDALTDGLKELSLRADEFIVTGKGSAAEAFQRLGYDAEELSRKLKQPDQLFLEIIGRLEKLDKAAQIRISDELFGGTGGEKFVQLISQGEQGLRRQIKAAEDLGLVMDEQMVKKAEEVNQKFQVISNTITTYVKAAIVDAVSAWFRFLDSYNDFQNQQQGTLESRQKEIMSEKNRIAQARQATLDNPNLSERNKTRAVSTFDEQLRKLNEEEDKIIAVMSQRAEQTRNMWTPPASPPGGFGGSTGKTDLTRFLAPGKDASHISGLSSSFEGKLEKMLADLPKELAGQIKINSGFRSNERQAQLWQEALAKYGSVSEARKWVAPPGNSQHNKGNAADLGYGSDAARQWVHDNASKYGLQFPLGNENWHIEDADARARSMEDRTKELEARGTAYDDIIAKAQQFIAAEGTEQQALSLTAEQAARLRYEQELLNEAKQQGLDLNPTQLDALKQLAAEMASAEERTRSLTKSQEDLKRSAEEFGQQAGSVAKGFVQDLISGKSAADSLKNALGRVAEMMLDSALSTLFGGSGTKGGGVFGSIFTSIFSGIGKNADGTEFWRGGATVVGERGPEVIHAPRGSRIIPNHQLPRADNGKGNEGNTRRELVVNVQGASGDNHIRELARQGAQEAVYQDRIEQERGRFGKTQQTYNARKG